MKVYGPYDTEAELRQDCAWSRGRRPVAGGHVEPNRGRLLQALAEAGVRLGERDARTVDWLAGWEPETVQVIVGLISRAHQAGIPAGSAAAATAAPTVEDLAADMRTCMTAPGAGPGAERWLALGHINAIARPTSSSATAAMSDAQRIAGIRDVLDALDLVDAGDADGAEWTTEQVLAWLAEQGSPVTAKTWSGYVSRGQAPAPARRIGRTPVWNPATIRTWYAGRRGQNWRQQQGTAKEHG